MLDTPLRDMGNKILFKFEEKTFLDSHMRNGMPKFQSCRLNDVATIEKTYTGYIYRYKHIAEHE